MIKSFGKYLKHVLKIKKKAMNFPAGFIKSYHSKSYKISDSIHGFKNFKIIKDCIKQHGQDLDLEINCLRRWLSSSIFLTIHGK